MGRGGRRGERSIPEQPGGSGRYPCDLYWVFAGSTPHPGGVDPSQLTVFVPAAAEASDGEEAQQDGVDVVQVRNCEGMLTMT